MRRRRLPSDSPRIVTRPGVKRNSMALWVTSIHDGIASGRHSTKIGGGRPAFSSAAMCSACLAAFSFHGGGLVFACRSWSVIFGFHTPLQSGSLARSAQSLGVGGGLMTAGTLLPASLDVSLGGCPAGWARTAAAAKAEIARIERENE